MSALAKSEPTSEPAPTTASEPQAAFTIYSYGYEERLAEQRRVLADPANRRKMRESLRWLKALAKKQEAAGACRVIEHDGRWSVVAAEPTHADASHTPSRAGRAAPRRRRELRRSSSRSGDSGDDGGSEPPWPRRLAARLSLHLADAAGYHALAHAIRHDCARKRWSS